MNLTIINQTSNALSYLSGLITVAANGSTTVTSQFIYPISRDPGLIADSVAINVILSDGVTQYENQNAVQYLDEIAASLGGAVVGYNGTTAPTYSIMVGAKDPNGNTQPGNVDVNGNLMTNDIINSSIINGNISVGTTAVPARVGSSNLASRKVIIISPTNGTVYLGASSVSIANGIPIFQNQVVSFSFSSNVTPYLIAASAVNVNIIEGS
jgi:hypothetical protein